MNKKALTLTVVANMTSNYSEGLGNVASVQKVFKNRRIYSMRSRESLKNAIMIQSGWYDDLETEVDGATQKKVNEDLNAINCRALEGGYMNTQATTYVRRSSFYVTDAISTEHFISDPDGSFAETPAAKDSIIIYIWQQIMQKAKGYLFKNQERIILD